MDQFLDKKHGFVPFQTTRGPGAVSSLPPPPQKKLKISDSNARQGLGPEYDDQLDALALGEGFDKMSSSSISGGAFDDVFSGVSAPVPLSGSGGKNKRRLESASLPLRLEALDSQIGAFDYKDAVAKLLARFKCSGVPGLHVLVQSYFSRALYERQSHCLVFSGERMSAKKGEYYLVGAWLQSSKVLIPWGFLSSAVRLEPAPLMTEDERNRHYKLSQDPTASAAQIHKAWTDAQRSAQMGFVVLKKDCVACLARELDLSTREPLVKAVLESDSDSDPGD